MLTKSDSLEIKGTLNELSAKSLSEGMPLLIRSRTDSTQTWTGTLSRIDFEKGSTSSGNSSYAMSDSSDSSTTSTKYPFYVSLDSEDGLILGQHVYIETNVDDSEASDEAAFSLPSYYIVDADTDVVNDAVKEAMVNIAMQIAALNPKYVSRDEISEEYIAHEKEILLAQIMNDPKESQKPEKVINGMIEGRVNKELKEICLVDQVYVKAEDGKQTVAKYLEEVSKEVGAAVSVKRFVRFETGEGIEKKQEDFAAEVAAQMNA